MTLLITEVRRLREATERQNELLEVQGERLTALEHENRELRQVLPPLQLDAKEAIRRPWWRVWERR